MSDINQIIDDLTLACFNVDDPADANQYPLQAIEEAKDEIEEYGREQREAGEVAFIKRFSTDNRPLSAPPELIEQPVPCTGCKATHYANWSLLPHQIYNAYMPGGVGHYCFPCFAALVTKATEVLPRVTLTSEHSASKRTSSNDPSKPKSGK
jgi:hypothetical protein